MFPTTSPQYQDLFKDCLGFARQLSQTPGAFCKLEVKLGENSFSFQTGSPGSFPGKRKSPSDYRRDQRRRKSPGKGMPTPGTQGVSSAAPGDTTKAQRRTILLPSPPCSRTVPWSEHLFSPSNIPQLDGAESLSSEELNFTASTPTVAPLVQYAHSRLKHKLNSTPLPTPSQPVCNKPAPSPPLIIHRSNSSSQHKP